MIWKNVRCSVWLFILSVHVFTLAVDLLHESSMVSADKASMLESCKDSAPDVGIHFHLSEASSSILMDDDAPILILLFNPSSQPLCENAMLSDSSDEIEACEIAGVVVSTTLTPRPGHDMSPLMAAAYLDGAYAGACLPAPCALPLDPLPCTAFDTGSRHGQTDTVGKQPHEVRVVFSEVASGLVLDESWARFILLPRPTIATPPPAPASAPAAGNATEAVFFSAASTSNVDSEERGGVAGEEAPQLPPVAAAPPEDVLRAAGRLCHRSEALVAGGGYFCGGNRSRPGAQGDSDCSGHGVCLPFRGGGSGGQEAHGGGSRGGGEGGPGVCACAGDWFGDRCDHHPFVSAAYLPVTAPLASPSRCDCLPRLCLCLSMRQTPSLPPSPTLSLSLAQCLSL
jgi:hypothetical protein